MSQVQLIVSKCVGDRVYGNRLVDETYDSVEEATKQAETHLRANVSVIVRPNYNETNDKGERYFREWRSFHGEPLREVSWKF